MEIDGTMNERNEGKMQRILKKAFAKKRSRFKKIAYFLFHLFKTYNSKSFTRLSCGGRRTTATSLNKTEMKLTTTHPLRTSSLHHIHRNNNTSKECINIL
jgi:hypothetical protein